MHGDASAKSVVLEQGEWSRGKAPVASTSPQVIYRGGPTLHPGIRAEGSGLMSLSNNVGTGNGGGKERGRMDGTDGVCVGSKLS